MFVDGLNQRTNKECFRTYYFKCLYKAVTTTILKIKLLFYKIGQL